MSHDSLEKSQEQGQPVEVYRFTVGPDSYFFTSAEDEQVVDLVTYEPEAIKRSKLLRGQEDREAFLELEVPASNLFAIRYAASVPGVRALLTIKRFHRTDTPTPQVVTVFVGHVKSVAFSNQGTIAKIQVRPLVSAASKDIPRFGYQALCNHVLYDAGCKVDPENAAFKLTSTITNVDGNVITVPGVTGFAANWFVAGFAELVSISDRRLVYSQSGNDLTLLLPFPQDVTGQQVVVRAGCDHTVVACGAKFFTAEDPTSNVINYGGFAWVPKKNPFQGLD